MSRNPVQRLNAAFSAAIEATLGAEFADADPVIRPASKPELGDFQCNAAMSLGKRSGRPPRELADELVTSVDLEGLAGMPEVAGPGFINIRLLPTALATALEDIDTPALGVVPDAPPKVVVIDLCGVNVAKQMHVGHLRSTIIGDALGRILTRLGHEVHLENHLGDWGLPIAMVMQALVDAGADLESLSLTDLDTAYRDAQAGARADVAGLEAAHRHAGPHRIAELEAQNEAALAARARAGETLVGLQSGDPDAIAQWKMLIDVTMRALHESLDILGIGMSEANNRGESFYRDRLGDVVSRFEAEGACREDAGALVVDFQDRERPMLIRKSDGGFLYATTDLAAVHCRTQETGAARCIYVVDARQRDHFRDVFDAGTLVGWGTTPDGQDVEFVHIPFGSVLGPDRKPLKTRSGDNVTLRSLLDEAVDRGVAEVERRAEDPRSPTHALDEAARRDIGRAVGIGAIKYADLSNDLVRDYVFDLDRMVAFEGDTGPYLQYAHARIMSLLRRGGGSGGASDRTPFILDAPEERRLALALLRYDGVVHDTGRSLEPHRIATYLRELAETFSAFYQACPVLKAEQDDVKRSRLRLAGLTGRILADGLGLLGIDAPDQM